MKDISGQTFERLTAVNVAYIKNHVTFWLCRCACGNDNHIISLQAWTRQKSCGCLRREVTTQRNTKHGFRKNYPIEYRAYLDAKRRCTDPNNARYKDYGERGIEFRIPSFKDFYAELGARPPGKLLDRANNNGHYEKGNLRWVTPLESANNRSRL